MPSFVVRMQRFVEQIQAIWVDQRFSQKHPWSPRTRIVASGDCHGRDVGYGAIRHPGCRRLSLSINLRPFSVRELNRADKSPVMPVLRRNRAGSLRGPTEAECKPK